MAPNVTPHKIRVVLPYHLRNLARVGAEVEVEVEVQIGAEGVEHATTQAVLDALEVRYPVLRGTIRDHHTKERRAFLRFFVCGEDISLQPTDAALPAGIAAGDEPFLVVGAIAGG